MSLATNVKEFADVLHNIYAQQLSSLGSTDTTSLQGFDLSGVLPLAIPKAVVLQQAFLYGAKSFSSGFLYLLTFQWLRDVSYLPLTSHEAPLNHDTFLSGPFSYLFSFAKNGGNSTPLQDFEKSAAPLMAGGDTLIAGLLNSFFFSFPFSLPFLITVRRMFSQGSAAALASILGTVAAHALIIAGVVHGSFQPLASLVGVFAAAIVITEFVKEKKVYLVPLTHYPSLVRIGALNFVLALCESRGAFHDIHHLTLNQQIAPLRPLQSEALYAAYVIAFVLGHVVFSLAFCYFFLKATERVCSFTGWTVPKTARQINRGLLVAVLIATLSSFPYFGLDYLVTKSRGFLPEDPAYRNTIFSPTQVLSGNRHFKSRAPATKNPKTPLELDVNYFDRGMYLAAPKEEKQPRPLVESSTSSPLAKDGQASSAATYDPVLSFEELNYQGESAWLMRHERARRLSDEQDSKKESVLQKPKTHSKQLRLKQDNKQAEAALRESSQVGWLSKWKEGDVSRSQSVDSYTKAGSSASEITRGHTADYRSHRDKRLLLKDLAFEKEIASNYEKSFASPFGEESDGTPPDLLPVENIIKKRYRLNPVYRALLQTDIDLFVARQPTSYRTTQNQDASLFKKRQLLERYYNSLRYYSPVEGAGFTKRHLAHLGDGNPRKEAQLLESKAFLLPFKKSFLEEVYYQQLKGSLNTVKRFFKLTLDEQPSRNKNRVLSYDQALYKKRHPSLTKQGFLQGDHHEELDLEKVSAFTEEGSSSPIYAGWDEKARRFVITNRFNLLQVQSKDLL